MTNSSPRRGLIPSPSLPPDSVVWEPRRSPIEPLIKPAKRTALWIGAIGLVGVILFMGIPAYCAFAEVVC